MPFGGTMLPWWALPQFLWLAGLRRDGRDGRPSWRGCTSLGLRCASFATVSGDGVRVAQAGTRGSRSRRAGGTAPTWSRSAWSGSAPTSPWTTCGGLPSGRECDPDERDAIALIQILW